MNKNYCIKGCEFLNTIADDFGVTDFFCSFYKKRLEIVISESKNSLRPLKCTDCQKDSKMTMKQAINTLNLCSKTMSGWSEYLKDLSEQIKNNLGE